MNRKLLFVFIILINASCSTPTPYPPDILAQTAMPLWTNPVSKPKYIDTVEVYASQAPFSPARMCLDLDSYGMWEPGDYGPDTYSRIQRTIRFDIDGVPQTDLQVLDELNDLTMFDANHKVIGSLGGPYETCVEVSKLADGLHIATVDFQTRSGKTLGYMWAFQVATVQDKITLQLAGLP